METLDQWTLGLTIFLPLAGVAAMVMIPAKSDRVHHGIALVTSFLVLLVGVYLIARFDFAESGLQFDVNNRWIDVINSRYHVGVDGISVPLLALSMLTTVACVLYSRSHLPEPHDAKAFLILVLLLETGVNGTFTAQDLLLFFVFFELVLVPMYFLVGVWGAKRRDYASLKFFVYTVLGSTFMLLSFLALYFLGGHTFDIPALSSAASPVHEMARNTQLLVFAGLLVGFAIKAPLFPVHTWMPDAHTEAPTVASVLLAGVLLKLGVYGLIRIALPVLPAAAKTFAPWIGLLAVIGIVYGALACLAQRDMKRLIAYSSLAHMGFAMLGVATLTAIGINGAVFAMVAHGLITGMLFFVAGSIQFRLATRDLQSLGGLLKTAPRLAWIFGLCAVASLGLPGLAGFWGEFSAILASFDPAPGLSLAMFRTFTVVAAVGVLLAAGYLLWMYQRVAFGKRNDGMQGNEVSDITALEAVSWAPLVLLIVVLGVYPALVFDVTSPAVKHLVERFGDRQ